MSLDAATAAEFAAVVTLAVLIVAIVVASSAGACGGRAGAVHDVELALGEATLMTYEQARAAGAATSGRASRAPPRQPASAAEEKEEPQERCALCLSEYAAAGEVVRVMPECGHFFHAECGVDVWLRKRGTCPLCRGGLACIYRSSCNQPRTNKKVTCRRAAQQASSMTPDAAFALEIAVVAALVVLMVAVVVASWGPCSEPAAAAAVHDVESAIGADTVVTYEQARAARKGMGGGTADQGCAICLSDYAGGDEAVRVLPACRHFFHAECIDEWLRKGRTCPFCRAEAWPLPRRECPPMPPRAGRATVGPP
ncbi:hypothetical protein BAE44_0002762 [Dichanthelium oligosanthes]|uniref:RING-type domain-containing protein n=1 Tax=Dichanthelium oligosanthes TaxID=888268 RepID=A0A1E5WFM9_9POAL|nr:hypothetical protein BAE44_0002762 [Dichanthelium oligosanthes]